MKILHVDDAEGGGADIQFCKRKESKTEEEVETPTYEKCVFPAQFSK